MVAYGRRHNSLGLISHLLVVIFCFVLDDMASMLMMFSLTSLVTFVMLYVLLC